MARIEWVKQRLENWALFKAREAGGGLGFASQSSFLGEADSSRYRESRIPIDDVDASVTDEAVESLVDPPADGVALPKPSVINAPLQKVRWHDVLAPRCRAMIVQGHRPRLRIAFPRL